MYYNARYILEKAVCSSARLSVCMSNNKLWQNERNFCTHLIPYEKNVYSSFRQEEWLVGNDILYLKFCAKRTPSKNADFQSIIAR